MSKALIEELAPNQKRAYLRMQKYLSKGYSITESAERADVTVSDFNNARARLKKLQDKIRPVGAGKTEKSEIASVWKNEYGFVMSRSDYNSLLKRYNKALTLFNEVLETITNE